MRSLLVVAVVGAVACSDAFEPTTENVSGTYQLSAFTSDSAGVQKDWVASGAALELVLVPAGDVSGRLWVPNNTQFFGANMIGTWALHGNTVHFIQDADTFVRDIDWIARRNRLYGNATLGVVRVHVVLWRETAPPP